MVSNASEDLPEPDGPVITVKVRRGISRSNPLRLCCRAPRTMMDSFIHPNLAEIAHRRNGEAQASRACFVAIFCAARVGPRSTRATRQTSRFQSTENPDCLG